MNPLQKKMLHELHDKSLFARALEFGSDYLHEAFDRNVYPTQEAIDALQHFEEKFPGETGNAADILHMLQQYAAPATVTEIAGRYFGFVNGSVVPAGLLAKLLATFWDQNTAMFIQSPAAAKLESVVESWLRTIFKLPDQTVAGFVSGTSSANLCALAAARYRLLQNNNWDVNEKGLAHAPAIKIVAGREAHSTIIKAINLLGFGKSSISFVDADAEGRIIPGALPPMDNSTLLILQAGNVNSGSFDNFSEICKKAKDAGAWVHIDGAFGLWAAASQKLQHLTSGIEYADSWAVDGHKTLNTPYDCGIVLCADSEALTAALSMTGAYIVLSEERDGMLFTPEMSRRARIFELWATLKYLGAKGLDAMITEMHARALQFADEIRKVRGFTVLNDVVFNQVVVCCESDELTVQVMRRVQEQRECWAGGSTWQKRKVIRVSICSWATTAEDITLSVRSFAKALAAIGS